MLISKSLADTNGALTLWQHFFLISPVHLTRVSYVPRNLSIAKDYLLGAKIDSFSETSKLLTLFLLHWFNHRLYECGFFVCQAILRIEFYICPRFAEILKGDESEIGS